MKKTAWLLCLIMCFSAFTSCSSNEGNVSSAITGNETVSQQTNASDNKAFSVPYFSQDSLNPYSATQSANFYLSTLLYDSLVTINNDFTVKNLIAEKIENNGTECTVTIKDNLKFSDDTPITDADVVASFNIAKNSTYYSQRLKNASKCTVKGGKIIFTLKMADKHFAKNLTFPIIKSGSSKSIAVGSGRYMLSDEDSKKLVINANNTRKNTKIETISLVDITKYSSLPSMIKIGSVNFVYGDFTQSINVPSAKSSSVIRNDLVYLGVNSNNIYLSNKDFRKAVSLCINRDNILTDAYVGAGRAAASPFNPKAIDLNNGTFKISSYDISAANELFTICSLIEKDENGFFKGNEEEAVSLRLLVNKDNSARLRAANSIKISLEKVGIKVNLIEENAENYKTKIVSGDYDLFIGEVILTADNNISSLLSQGALNGCNDEGGTLKSYYSFLANEISLDDFLRTFDLNTPFIPLVYKNSKSIYSASLSGNSECTEYDVFAQMENWEY